MVLCGIGKVKRFSPGYHSLREKNHNKKIITHSMNLKKASKRKAPLGTSPHPKMALGANDYRRMVYDEKKKNFVVYRYLFYNRFNQI
jgi:hypothetical protein